MAGDFDILILSGLDPDSHAYIKGDALLVAASFSFLKGDAILSYPEIFITSDSFLEALRIPYVKSGPALQARRELYIKGDAVGQKHVEIYMRGVVTFLGGVDFGEYLKGDVGFLALRHSYLRGDVVFNVSALFVKGMAALVRAPNLEELGNNPPATKPGVLSRQYLSIAAVKKEV
jgi:hypothetical protein